MSIINCRRNKIIAHVLVIAILFSSCGCVVLNLLPNRERDQWYMDHADDMNKLFDLQHGIGLTRKEVLEKWGEPLKVINSDHWIYYFPDIAREKTHIQFKNDIVTKTWQ